MPKKKYTAEFKTKVILTIIQGDKEFNVICADFNLNPSMVRKWKQEFLQNAHRAFDSDSEQKAAQRKEAHLKRKNDQMLKPLGRSRWNAISFRGAFAKLEKQSQASRTMIRKSCKLSLRRQCELLGVNRSGLYYLLIPHEALEYALPDTVYYGMFAA